MEILELKDIITDTRNSTDVPNIIFQKAEEKQITELGLTEIIDSEEQR